MKINTALLSLELHAANIPIDGCDSAGGIQFQSNVTAAQREQAAVILAAHDGTKLTAAEVKIVDARKFLHDQKRAGKLSPEAEALAILINALD